jgi:flagellar basal body-associated protein FliL
MSESCRHILQSMLIFVAAVALGLTTAWVVLKLQKQETAVSSFEQVVPTRP